MDSQQTAHKRARAGLRIASAAFAVVAAFGAIASTGDVTFAAKPNKPPKNDVQASLKKSVLQVTGTNSGEIIVLRLRAGQPGTIEVDVADDGSADFNFKKDRVETIVVNANDGDDTIRIDESNGIFTDTIATTLNGDDGNDEIHGGSEGETLNGGGGDDTVFGGAGNDIITGGAGNDQVFAGDGNDRMIWNSGDGTDLLEGEGWTDVVEVNGSDGDETFTLTANGLRVRFDRINPAPFSLDIGTTEYFYLNANGGNDQFSATGNLAALIHVSVDGGPGDDTLLGSNGVDVL
ncbi:MAG: hypothetical protein J5J06_15625, partial [Phycisphaerae bacterium]|nr:hypothetical protein [Phycisphaerae bacterium]